MASEGEVPQLTNKQLNASKKRKRERRKKKKKQKKPLRLETIVEVKRENVEEDEKVDFEYVSEPLMMENDPAYAAFKDVFRCFAPPEELCMSREEREIKMAEDEAKEAAEEKPSTGSGDTTNDEASSKEGEDEGKAAMSKREKKKQKRLSVAVLKQIVPRPEVVEVWDVTAADPVLLVHLKSYRNTVPVPRHWCQKRKYLQGKRGLEKPPFELPDFIAATGISRIRQAIQEQEEQKKQKQKQREKMQPKMGKMDIDYQVLHDAFFKHQTKPKLSVVGDLYYEGKEFEVKLKEKRPGQLSDELKAALGMPEGAPPPWLINMQRYGPPPSYPNLKIPGLNAPIPPGAQFGYHPGGWGKPPVDQFGKPLYGDVFGTALEQVSELAEPIDKKHWGELEYEELESEEEEEEEEEEEAASEEEEEDHAPPVVRPPQPVLESGLETPTGIETPDHLVLRKKVEAPEEPRSLYKVLKQKDTAIGSAAFGSSHTYVIEEDKKKTKDAVNLIKSQKTKEVELTLNPSELENLTDAVLKEKYETTVASSSEQEKEDVSDLLAEHNKKSRAKAVAKDKEKKGKDKYKFKF